MKKTNKVNKESEMLAEYDFSGGIRGKYAAKLAEENGYIRLDPQVSKFFKKTEDVNKILLAIISSIPKKEKTVSI